MIFDIIRDLSAAKCNHIFSNHQNNKIIHQDNDHYFTFRIFYLKNTGQKNKIINKILWKKLTILLNNVFIVRKINFILLE